MYCPSCMQNCITASLVQFTAKLFVIEVRKIVEFVLLLREPSQDATMLVFNNHKESE